MKINIKTLPILLCSFIVISCNTGQEKNIKTDDKKGLNEFLSQQKLLIFTNNPVGTAKVCKKFEKDLKKLSAEAAFFDNTLYTKDDIAKVATLPSLDEIRGKIVGLINAPASKLVRLLQRPDQDIISILQNKKD